MDKFLKKTALSTIISFSIILNLNYAKAEEASHTSIGFAGTFGYYDIYEKKGELAWDYALGYGGGLIIEHMFNNVIGFHSGIWYTEFKINLTMTDYSDPSATEPESQKVNVKTRIISVPVLMITSLNLSFFSINLLTGFNFKHIVDSKMSNTDETGANQTYNSLIHMNYAQICGSAGLNLKFRVSNYVDLFIGGIAEMSMIELLKDEGGESHAENYLYGFRGFTGVMFRTNIFPTKKNNY